MESPIDAIVDAVRRVVPRSRRTMVAIDGVGASGKSTFATALASHLEDRAVVILHEDDFFNAAEVRHARGRYSAEGFWLDTYNLSAFRGCALEPLARGDATYRRGSFDRTTGQPARLDDVAADPQALVIVEGTFLLRDELSDIWDFSIFLDIDRDESSRRMRLRLGPALLLDSDLLDRYHGAQRLYLSSSRPWERASVVIDNSILERPVIIDASEARASR